MSMLRTHILDLVSFFMQLFPHLATIWSVVLSLLRLPNFYYQFWTLLYIMTNWNALQKNLIKGVEIIFFLSRKIVCLNATIPEPYKSVQFFFIHDI